MKILVAGIGNVFLGDDGFGPAVIEALQARPPAGSTVADFGIRGMDLAYALTSGIDAAILIDAVARGGAPGTLYVIEPAAGDGAPAAIETHAMDPARVLRFATSLGPTPAFVRVIGCEPSTVPAGDDDIAVGLSAPVAEAIAPAVVLVGELVAKLVGVAGATCTS